MVTVFQVGDSVIAKVSAQGLQAGSPYMVTSLVSQDTYFGNFVRYQLEGADGVVLWISNGHLLLDRAEQMQGVSS